jgi:N-acetylglucosaminyldiphosphoundecaprenol N-acetyl-beta-D-mannosaminyltransferase
MCQQRSGENNNVPRVNVLGVGISAVNIPTAVGVIENWIIHRERHYVCVSPVHSVMEAQRDESFKHILNNAGLNTPDGMPMVWLGRLHRFRKIDRVYGPDLMLALCELSARKGYRNFFYGSAPGVPEKLAANMRARFPGFKTVGTFSPPFRPLTQEEDKQVVNMINGSHADILWVGIGSPGQERWMATHLGRVEAPVLLGVGAAFDFHSGRIKQAPYWIQRSGMEWLYRLIREPRRLARRYLTTNPLFLLHISLQLTGLRTYPIKPRASARGSVREAPRRKAW